MTEDGATETLFQAYAAVGVAFKLFLFQLQHSWGVSLHLVNLFAWRQLQLWNPVFTEISSMVTIKAKHILHFRRDVFAIKNC